MRSHLSQCAVNRFFMIFADNYEGCYEARIPLDRQAVLNYEDFLSVLLWDALNASEIPK